MKTIHMRGNRLSVLHLTAEQLPNLGGQIAHVNGLRWRHDIEPVADIFELTNISWPAKTRQQIHRSIREPLGVRPQTSRAGAQEMSGKQGHILRPLAQSRQAQTNDI